MVKLSMVKLNQGYIFSSFKREPKKGKTCLSFFFFFEVNCFLFFQGALSGLRQFLATESPLKMIKIYSRDKNLNILRKSIFHHF